MIDLSKVCDAETLRQIHEDAVRLNMPHKALVAALRLAFIASSGKERDWHLIEVARLHDMLNEVEKDPVRAYSHLCDGFKMLSRVREPPKGLELQFHLTSGRLHGKMSFCVLEPESSKYAKKAIASSQEAMRCVNPGTEIDAYIETVTFRVELLEALGKKELARACLHNVLKNVMFRVIHDACLVGRIENARKTHEAFLALAKRFGEDPKGFYPDGWQPLPPPLPPRRNKR